MYQISKTSVNRAINGILAVAIAISLLGIATDFRNTLRHGGTDLRNRIIGARLLSQGLDPYYYRWRPGDPETLRDPMDIPELPVSRVTVAPIGLTFYTPFASLPYRTQRLIWLVLQQLALFASLALLIFTTANPRNRLVLALCLLVVNSHFSWRFHVETGQIYIFYVFLIALFYWCLSQKFQFHRELSGLSLGLAVAIRPPLLVMALPLLLFKKIRHFAMTLLGTAVWLLMSVLLYGREVWVNYFSAMSLISKLSREEIKINVTTAVELPQVLEGVPFGALDISEGYETSLALRFYRILGFHPSVGFLLVLIIAICLGYLFAAFQLYKTRRDRQIPQIDVVLMLGGVLVLIVDFLIPTPRYSYNDVFYLVPLVPVLKYIQWNRYLETLAISLLLLGLLLMGGVFIWIPFIKYWAGQWLVLAALTFASLLILRSRSTSDSPQRN